MGIVLRWIVIPCGLLLLIGFVPAEGQAQGPDPILAPPPGPPIVLPGEGLMLPGPADGLIRTEGLVIGVSRSGKRVFALSLDSGELHTQQTDARTREEVRVFASPHFAAFRLKNKVYAISSRQGGWQELSLEDEDQFVHVSLEGVEVHSGDKHCFFLKSGKWVVMDLSAE